MRNILKTQHKILEVLLLHRKEYIKSNYKIPAGITWSEISEKVGCTNDELTLIAAPLVVGEEMQAQGRTEILIYAITEPKGLAALGSKKYLVERKNKVILTVKDWVSILIPLVSVILSFTIYIRSEIKQGQQSKVIKELRLEVDQLQKRIK